MIEPLKLRLYPEQGYVTGLIKQDEYIIQEVISCL